MGNCNVSGEEKRGGWCRETNLSRREKRKNIREDIRRTLVPLLHLSLLLVTRSLPRRDPQMQIFRCICLNRVDLRPFSPSCSPSIPNTTHALPFLCFSPLSLFFSLSDQRPSTRFLSYPPCRLLFYLKPEFPSVRARVQIYSKTVQLSRRSNTPLRYERIDRSSFRKFGNNAFSVESLLASENLIVEASRINTYFHLICHVQNVIITIIIINWK